MKQLPIFDDQNLKRYYSIGEVAEMFGVSKSLLRFWENEFDHLKPHKNSKGDRRFTRENLEQLQLIHHLVKERGFTLEGAKKEIKDQKGRYNKRRKVVERLKKLRKFLEELREKI